MEAFREGLNRISAANVVLALICLNLFCFGYEIVHLSNIDEVFYRFGVVASNWRIGSFRQLVDLPGLLLSLISSQFFHAGWSHLITNIIFLAAFGPSLEKCLGHLRFLVLYLVSGTGAIGIHLLINPGASIPLLGASGAIAGVLGAYLLLFPHKPLVVHIPLRRGFKRFSVKTHTFLGFWFLLIWLQGVARIGEAIQPGQGALWVHITGFLLGMVGAILVHPGDLKNS